MSATSADARRQAGKESPYFGGRALDAATVLRVSFKSGIEGVRK